MAPSGAGRPRPQCGVDSSSRRGRSNGGLCGGDRNACRRSGQGAQAEGRRLAQGAGPFGAPGLATGAAVQSAGLCSSLHPRPLEVSLESLRISCGSWCEVAEGAVSLLAASAPATVSRRLSEFMRYHLKTRARSSAVCQHAGTRSPRCRARWNLRLAASRCLGAGGPERSCGAGPIGDRASSGRIFSLCRYACRHPIEICVARLLKLTRSLEGDIFKHENSKDSAGSNDPVLEHGP